jgi:non-specific serine/threonine protein kinase/serine/threonine-protein kinase
MSKAGGTNDDPRRQDAIPTVVMGPDVPVPGGRIGPYELLEVLGEGGFATVHLARQDEPVRRQVALKIVKPGMDSQALIARFEAERQALALLSHPGIARVFDAGTTEAGRPYFVMEYVKGASITDHCDRHKLSIEQRLQLFLQVCDAVQHAHQKGIIHRDLKPPNILVSVEGESALPKVIDFGIAKAIHQPLTARALHTEAGQVIGTPEYMSPEQADRIGQDIDTRSDVYSLGVILYELLSGALPLEGGTLRAAGPEFMARMLREQDPKTPSTRLREFAPEQLAATAQDRRVEPGALHRRLRGDLDWITLKALDRDRTRRYGSVGELMADIGRHLRYEPVVAGPPSAAYRLKKFVRRHKALAAGLAAVLVVLVAGMVVAGSFAVQSERHARTAEAVARFLTRDLLGLVDPNRAGGQGLNIRYLLDGASRNLHSRFRDEPLVEASIREALGDTYLRLGESRLAESHFERIVELRRQHLGPYDSATLAAMARLAQVYRIQARYEQARQLSAEVLAITHRLRGERDPATLNAVRQLAFVHVYQSRYDQAEPLLTRALETSRHAFGATYPLTLDLMAQLGRIYVQQGRYDDAEPLLLRCEEVRRQKLGPDDPATAASVEALIGLYEAWGKPQEIDKWRARQLGDPTAQ